MMGQAKREIPVNVRIGRIASVILADIALLVEALPLVAFIVAIPVLPPPRWPGKP